MSDNNSFNFNFNPTNVDEETPQNQSLIVDPEQDPVPVDDEQENNAGSFNFNFTPTTSQNQSSPSIGISDVKPIEAFNTTFINDINNPFENNANTIPNIDFDKDPDSIVLGQLSEWETEESFMRWWSDQKNTINNFYKDNSVYNPDGTIAKIFDDPKATIDGEIAFDFVQMWRDGNGVDDNGFILGDDGFYHVAPRYINPKRKDRYSKTNQEGFLYDNVKGEYVADPDFKPDSQQNISQSLMLTSEMFFDERWKAADPMWSIITNSEYSDEEKNSLQQKYLSQHFSTFGVNWQINESALGFDFVDEISKRFDNYGYLSLDPLIFEAQSDEFKLSYSNFAQDLRDIGYKGPAPAPYIQSYDPTMNLSLPKPVYVANALLGDLQIYFQEPIKLSGQPYDEDPRYKQLLEINPTKDYISGNYSNLLPNKAFSLNDLNFVSTMDKNEKTNYINQWVKNWKHDSLKLFLIKTLSQDNPYTTDGRALPKEIINELINYKNIDSIVDFVGNMEKINKESSIIDDIEKAKKAYASAIDAWYDKNITKPGIIDAAYVPVIIRRNGNINESYLSEISSLNVGDGEITEFSPNVLYDIINNPKLLEKLPATTQNTLKDLVEFDARSIIGNKYLIDGTDDIILIDVNNLEEGLGSLLIRKTNTEINQKNQSFWKRKSVLDHSVTMGGYFYKGLPEDYAKTFTDLETNFHSLYIKPMIDKYSYWSPPWSVSANELNQFELGDSENMPSYIYDDIIYPYRDLENFSLEALAKITPEQWLNNGYNWTLYNDLEDSEKNQRKRNVDGYDNPAFLETDMPNVEIKGSVTEYMNIGPTGRIKSSRQKYDPKYMIMSNGKTFSVKLRADVYEWMSVLNYSQEIESQKFEKASDAILYLNNLYDKYLIPYAHNLNRGLAENKRRAYLVAKYYINSNGGLSFPEVNNILKPRDKKYRKGYFSPGATFGNVGGMESLQYQYGWTNASGQVEAELYNPNSQDFYNMFWQDVNNSPYAHFRDHSFRENTRMYGKWFKAEDKMEEVFKSYGIENLSYEYDYKEILNMDVIQNYLRDLHEGKRNNLSLNHNYLQSIGIHGEDVYTYGESAPGKKDNVVKSVKKKDYDKKTRLSVNHILNSDEWENMLNISKEEYNKLPSKLKKSIENYIYDVFHQTYPTSDSYIAIPANSPVAEHLKWMGLDKASKEQFEKKYNALLNDDYILGNFSSDELKLMRISLEQGDSGYGNVLKTLWGSTTTLVEGLSLGTINFDLDQNKLRQYRLHNKQNASDLLNYDEEWQDKWFNFSDNVLKIAGEFKTGKFIVGKSFTVLRNTGKFGPWAAANPKKAAFLENFSLGVVATNPITKDLGRGIWQGDWDFKQSTSWDAWVDNVMMGFLTSAMPVLSYGNKKLAQLISNPKSNVTQGSLQKQLEKFLTETFEFGTGVSAFRIQAISSEIVKKALNTPDAKLIDIVAETLDGQVNFEAFMNDISFYMALRLNGSLDSVYAKRTSIEEAKFEAMYIDAKFKEKVYEVAPELFSHTGKLDKSLKPSERIERWHLIKNLAAKYPELSSKRLREKYDAELKNLNQIDLKIREEIESNRNKDDVIIKTENILDKSVNNQRIMFDSSQANSVVESHNNNKSSTSKPSGEVLNQKTGYNISVKGSKKVINKEQITSKDIFDFIQGKSIVEGKEVSNAEILRESGFNISTRVENGKTIIEITNNISNIAGATSLSSKYGSKQIYDVKNKQYIDIDANNLHFFIKEAELQYVELEGLTSELVSLHVNKNKNPQETARYNELLERAKFLKDAVKSVRNDLRNNKVIKEYMHNLDNFLLEVNKEYKNNPEKEMTDLEWKALEAVITNSYQSPEYRNYLEKALEMPLNERAEAYKILNKYHDIYYNTLTGKIKENIAPWKQGLKEYLFSEGTILHRIFGPLNTYRNYVKWKNVSEQDYLITKQVLYSEYAKIDKQVNDLIRFYDTFSVKQKSDAVEVLSGIKKIEDTNFNEAQKTVIELTRKTFDEVGQRLVDHGILDKASYKKWKGQYFPRIFKFFELKKYNNKNYVESDKITLDFLKKRNEDITPEAELRLGLIKDPTIALNTILKSQLRLASKHDHYNQLILNSGLVLPQSKFSFKVFEGKKEITQSLEKWKEHYEDVSNLHKIEIKNGGPRDPALETYLKSLNKKIKKAEKDGLKFNPGPGFLKGNTHAGYTKIQSSDGRYGILEGMWVKNQIHYDITHNYKNLNIGEYAPTGIKTIYKGIEKGYSIFKITRVALNIPTVARNMMSTPQQMIYGGMNPITIMEHGGKSIKSMIEGYKYSNELKKLEEIILKNGKFNEKQEKRYEELQNLLENNVYHQAKESGLFGKTISDTELKILEKAHSEALDYSQGNLKKYISKLMEIPGLYGKIDEFYKLTYFSWGKKQGYDNIKAAKEANYWVFDYNYVSPVTDFLRKFPGIEGTPFITHYSKVVPLQFRAAKERPIRYSFVQGLKYSWVPALMYNMLAGDVGDKKIEAVNKKYKLNSIQGEYGQINLPYLDENGNAQFMDITYLYPEGSIYNQVAHLYNMVEGSFGEEGFSAFHDSEKLIGPYGQSPLLQSFLVATTGKVIGKNGKLYNVTTEDMTPMEKIDAKTQWMLENYIIPPSLHENGALMNYIRGGKPTDISRADKQILESLDDNQLTMALFGLNPVPVNEIIMEKEFWEAMTKEIDNVDKRYDRILEEKINESIKFEFKDVKITDKDKRELKKFISDGFAEEKGKEIEAIINKYYDGALVKATNGEFSSLQELYDFQLNHSLHGSDFNPELLNSFYQDFIKFENNDPSIDYNEIKENVKKGLYPKGHPYYKLYLLMK